MQTLTDLRWDDLRVFLALYRHGSLKKGAQALGVNISTASRRLDALEASTGVHLFDRTPEGARATAAAEQLLPFAESMEQAAHGFARGVEAFEAEPEGEVRITAPPGLVDHFVATALPRLCDAYPRLRIKLESAIGYSDLTRRFSRSELVDLPFLLTDVEQAAISTSQLEEGSHDCAGAGWQRFTEPRFSSESDCRTHFTAALARRLTDFVDD